MIYFNTDSAFDIRALSLMGVSVKNEDSIGRFGTGLKYAVSVILRVGGTISIRVLSDLYTFRYASSDFRGKQITLIEMVKNDTEVTELPFSAEYGKFWEPWMALRELYSNTKDEGGTITTDYDADQTACIIVSGTHFDASWAAKSDWLFSPTNPPLFTAKPGDLTYSFYPGVSDWIFYQGIRVNTTKLGLPFTIDIAGFLSLTEDRTLHSESSQFAAILRAAAGLPLPRQTFIELLQNPNAVSHQIASSTLLSDNFINACDSGEVDDEWRELVRARFRKSAYDIIPMASHQERVLTSAITRLSQLIPGAELSKVKLAKLRGLMEIVCVPKENTIYVSPRLISDGNLTAELLISFIELEQNIDRGSLTMDRYLAHSILSLL